MKGAVRQNKCLSHGTKYSIWVHNVPRILNSKETMIIYYSLSHQVRPLTLFDYVQINGDADLSCFLTAARSLAWRRWPMLRWLIAWLGGLILLVCYSRNVESISKWRIYFEYASRPSAGMRWPVVLAPSKFSPCDNCNKSSQGFADFVLVTDQPSTSSARALLCVRRFLTNRRNHSNIRDRFQTFSVQSVLKRRRPIAPLPDSMPCL